MKKIVLGIASGMVLVSVFADPIANFTQIHCQSVQDLKNLGAIMVVMASIVALSWLLTILGSRVIAWWKQMVEKDVEMK